jgi:hypothetical protein
LQQKHKSETPGQKCTKCNQVKLETDFRLHNSKKITVRRRECIECEKKYAKGRLKAHKQASPKASNCQICGSDRNLVMDHCHHTEKFRGWICSNCNTGIGRFNDDPQLLLKAFNYLTNGSQI